MSKKLENWWFAMDVNRKISIGSVRALTEV